ncbi:MAG: hypothetical protein JXQ87_05825 [Bacteroidia bacterium]
MKKLLPFFLLLCTLTALNAQDKAYEVKQAKTEDVESINGIISTLYEVISGEAGSKKDWKRFKSLWYPGANLSMVTATSNNASKQITMDLDEFIKLSSNHSNRNSFYEIEINRTTAQVGHISSVVSTYVIKNEPNASEVQIRGVNMFQLYFDGKRW